MGLEIVEFVMTVEEQFGIELADEDVERINTVGEFHQLVAAKLGVDEPLPAIVPPRTARDSSPEAVQELLETLPAWPPAHRPIWDEICRILIKERSIPPHLITPAARFVDDLDMG